MAVIIVMMMANTKLRSRNYSTFSRLNSAKAAVGRDQIRRLFLFFDLIIILFFSFLPAASAAVVL